MHGVRELADAKAELRLFGAAGRRQQVEQMVEVARVVPDRRCGLVSVDVHASE